MIVTLYAAMLAFIFIGLSVHVVLGRRAEGAALGNGEFALLRRVRAHANFIEYTPLFLLLFSFAEMQGMASWAGHLFGMVFVAARLSHAFSLLHHERYEQSRLLQLPLFRMAGMIGTFFCIAALAVVLLVQYF